MVNAMPASDYVRFLKSARMLFAEKRMADIETASFPHYKDDHRSKVMRELSRASKQFISEGVADFGQFAASIAKRLMQNG